MNRSSYMLAALLGAALLTGCAAEDVERPRMGFDSLQSGSAPSEPPFQSVPLPAEWRPLVDSLRARVEAPLLERDAPGVERREWDRLVITARNGTRRVFIDEVVGTDLRRVHAYRGYLPEIEAHLVEVVFVPEGGQLLLVGAQAGDTTEVDAPPVASPAGERFVTASLDLVAGHRPNRIRVYRMEPRGPTLEWEMEPREWGAERPVWVDQGTIRLRRGEVDWNATPLEIRYSTLYLRRRGAGWVAEEPEPGQVSLARLLNGAADAGMPAP